MSNDCYRPAGEGEMGKDAHRMFGSKGHLCWGYLDDGIKDIVTN